MISRQAFVIKRLLYSCKLVFLYTRIYLISIAYKTLIRRIVWPVYPIGNIISFFKHIHYITKNMNKTLRRWTNYITSLNVFYPYVAWQVYPIGNIISFFKYIKYITNKSTVKDLFWWQTPTAFVGVLVM